MRGRRAKQGKLAGTGAAINVVLGYKPDYVRVINVTQKSITEMTPLMSAAKGIQTLDSGSGTTDIAELSSAGITLTESGFKLGTNAALNTASDVIYYIAW